MRALFLLAIAVTAVFVVWVVPVHAGSAAPKQSFLALCYHNIEDKNPDQTFEGVTTGKLIEQLNWLKSEGYRAVSIDDILAAHSGKKPLPPKAVLLTFDDGYESFYTRVYPVLRAYHFPAVVAIVDQWMDGAPGGKVRYGNGLMARDMFLTWAQIKEMQDSGLVEVASHSDALHFGTKANPQGNSEPATVTAAYDPKTGRYETAGSYEKRLAQDAEKSAQTIAHETGRRPRVIVWPYGAGNRTAMTVYKKHGMPVSLSLEDGFADAGKLNNVPRFLVNRDPEIGDFVISMRQIDRTQPVRVVQVDLDYIYDPDPAQEERNLDALVTRIYDLQINTVFLQAFADPEGDGLARQVYFPNRYLPVRADLFNRVVWQLKTRARVSVYGWLPVLSFDFGGMAKVAAEDERDESAYHRLSPFDAGVRAKIAGIYEDMARHAPIDGLLFHDDAMLSDFEDASPSALQAYRRAGFPASIEIIRANPALLKKWAAFKTDTLIGFTQQLADAARRYRAPLKTARNIYAAPVLDPDSETWLAQNYERFLKAYDYTAIEAMPRMENIDDSDAEAWLKSLVAAAARQPDGLGHTIFELQAVDWRKSDDDAERAISAEELGAQMDLLARNGAMNFGYYPDDFITGSPNAAALHAHFSLQSYPYLP